MNKFKIATFNLNGNKGNFPNRIYNLSNVLNKIKVDMFCFQEDFNLEKFASGKFLNLELDYNYITSKSSNNNNMTILSKHKIELVDEIYFNKNKENETICQFVNLDFNGYEIFVVNLELTKVGVRNRIEHINSVLDNINRLCHHELVILVGSLNVIPSFPEINKIEDSGFRSKNKEHTHEDKVILDYIFYKTFMKIKCESEVLLKGYSDNRMLINSFILK